MFKVIRSNIEIAITRPSWISRAFKLFFGTEFHHITCDTLQMFKVKGQGHRAKLAA